MQKTSKIVFKEWIFIVVAFTVLMYFYVFISYFGLKHLMKETYISEYMRSGYIHLELMLTSVLFGSLFALINTLTDTSRMQKKSFGAVIILRSLLYFVSFLVTIICIYYIYNIFQIVSEEEWKATLDLFTPLYLLSFVSYVIAVIIFINFILQVNRKFGPGNLLKLLIGKYSIPKKENQLFMFMDLRGSTAIAEKLGHHKYSEMMQSCFHDLTNIVIKYNASIYQYVGDEVVLCWDTAIGLKNINCIRAYFEFIDILKSKEEYYLAKFNMQPYFKCGIDCGEVTVAEIGDIKREIAYHGDVLNTAARIEKLCTPQNQRMLISEFVEQKLPVELNGFNKEIIGDFELKGKKEKIKIYSINKT